jgi:hypothetical protein
MTEQRYAVPEEGLNAVPYELRKVVHGTVLLGDNIVKPILEAFICWQAENPRVPTGEQLWACGMAVSGQGIIPFWGCSAVIAEWQRQMYLAPDSEAEQKVTLYNEVEIGWSCGMVTAGPFIRENVVWTPEQADQMAEYLKGAAQKARERNSSPDQLSPKGVDDLLWQGKKIYDHQPHELNAAHDADVNEAFRRGKDSHA